MSESNKIAQLENKINEYEKTFKLQDIINKKNAVRFDKLIQYKKYLLDQIQTNLTKIIELNTDLEYYHKHGYSNEITPDEMKYIENSNLKLNNIQSI